MKKSFPKKDIHATIIHVFANTLGVKPENITPATAYNSHPKWDSLKHLEIISNLEQAFKIDISMENVIAMSTVKKAEAIIARLVS